MIFLGHPLSPLADKGGRFKTRKEMEEWLPEGFTDDNDDWEPEGYVAPKNAPKNGAPKKI
jgi:hypothetical protein